MEQKPVYVFAKWQVKEGELDTVLNLLTEVTQKAVLKRATCFTISTKATPSLIRWYWPKLT